MILLGLLAATTLGGLEVGIVRTSYIFKLSNEKCGKLKRWEDNRMKTGEDKGGM